MKVEILAEMLAQGRQIHADALQAKLVDNQTDEWESAVANELDDARRAFFMGALEPYYLHGQEVPLDHPLSRIHTRTLRLRRIIEDLRK